MSRHQLHLATSIPNKPGRDVKMMSRPPALAPMLRRQNDVATSYHLSLIYATSRRHVATSLATSHVATSLATSHVATSLRCRDIKTASIMSRRQISVATPPRPLHVATSSPAGHFLLQLSQVATSLFLVATSRPTTPGRDLISMSRPQQVLTCSPFFFFSTASSSLPCYSLRCSSLNTTLYTLLNF